MLFVIEAIQNDSYHRHHHYYLFSAIKANMQRKNNYNESSRHKNSKFIGNFKLSQLNCLTYFRLFNIT